MGGFSSCHMDYRRRIEILIRSVTKIINDMKQIKYILPIICIVILSFTRDAPSEWSKYMKLKVDEFTGDSTYTQKTDNKYALYLTKVKPSSEEPYVFMSMSGYGYSPIAGKHGVTIMLADGNRIDRPRASIYCSVSRITAYGSYRYSSSFSITSDELEMLSKSNPIKFRVYSDEKVSRKTQRNTSIVAKLMKEL